MLYPEIAPWSRFAAQFRAMIATELAELGNPEGHSLEHLLETNKKVAREILNQPHFYFPTNEGFFRHLMRYLWPPFRVFRILDCWRRLPGSAVELAERHRPDARILIMGHTHFPGVWKRRGRTVINTGSFLPGSDASASIWTPTGWRSAASGIETDSFYPGRVVRTTF